MKIPTTYVYSQKEVWKRGEDWTSLEEERQKSNETECRSLSLMMYEEWVWWCMKKGFDEGFIVESILIQNATLTHDDDGL